MTLKRKLLYTLIFLCALTGCATGGGNATPTPVPTPIVAQKPTYTVERGTVSRVLELRGRVVAVKQQDIFFRTDGFFK